MFQDNEFLWVEKFRPKTIAECILPDFLMETFKGMLHKEEIQNLLLCGGPGTGKTTVPRALCNELGCDYLMLNGSLGAEESGIDAFRTKVRHFASSMSFSGKRKVVIIDEADYLNPNSSQPALRALMEEFSNNCSFVFTCNYRSKLIEPIHSRCSVIEFKYGSKEDRNVLIPKFVKRLSQILEEENIEVTSKKVLVEFVLRFYPDFRRTINELQKYVTSGYDVIDEGLLKQYNLAETVTYSKLILSLKNRRFNEIREWVVEALSEEPQRLFRNIYMALSDKIKPTGLPHLIVLLAEYQFKAAFCIDPEIIVLAFLTEVMVSDEIEFLP